MRRLAPWMLLPVVLVGCRQGAPTAPTAVEPELSVFGTLSFPAHQLAQSTRAVVVDVPEHLPAWFQTDQALEDGVAAADGRVLIALKQPGTPRAMENGGVRPSVPPGALAEAISLLASFDTRDAWLIGDLGILVARVPPGVASSLEKMPWVDWIEPDIRLEVFASSSPSPVPFFTQTTPWGVTMVGAQTAWTVENGSGASVMIVDTGFEDGHEDLVNVSSSNCFGTYGGCFDGAGHGTHVIGDLLARNNSLGYVGVAPGVAAADVYSWGACDGNGCNSSQVAAGVYKADTLGVDVLNLSLGSTTYNGSVATAVSAAISGGVSVAAAGGNDTGSQPVWPAAMTYVVAASGVLPNYSFASTSPCGNSSGYGSHIDVAAPFWSHNTAPGDDYDQRCGTSMATPHVAGVAALIKAEWPSFDNFDIRTRIRGTTIDLGATGYDYYFGHGLVSAANALGPFPTIDGEFSLEQNQTCSWGGSSGGGYGSITLEWYVNGFYEGSGPVLWYDVGQDSFWLALKATDQQGATRTKTQFVSVSGSGYSCPE